MRGFRRIIAVSHTRRQHSKLCLRRLDGTAVLMPENDQQTDMQLVDSVFERGEHTVIDDLPCCPNREHIAETGIEDDFRRHPGIRTRQHSRIGTLRIKQ